jgi:hypothetical protein
MGAVEEAGKAAAHVAEGLKASPVLLTLVVLQVVQLLVVVWVSTHNRAADAARFNAVMSLCGPKASESREN